MSDRQRSQIIKVAITVAPEDSYAKALVVFRGLAESLPVIADLGYDGVELAVYRKENVDIPTLKKQLSAHGLAIPVISTGQMFTMLDVWFTNPDSSIRKCAVEVFKGIIDLASEFGADINVSRVRGYIHEEDSFDDGIARLTECLQELCAYAGEHGLSLLLEQMNRYETNYMNSAQEVGEYVRNLGLPNLKIHADTFHMNIEDSDINGTLTEYSKELGYVHLADSNRLAPGKGHIDFRSLLKTLRETHYGGWLGIEVLTKPSSVEAARGAIEHIRALDPQ